jgi:hypothetical protein
MKMDLVLKINKIKDFILSSHKIKTQSHLQLNVGSNHNEQ